MAFSYAQFSGSLADIVGDHTIKANAQDREDYAPLIEFATSTALPAVPFTK